MALKKRRREQVSLTVRFRKEIGTFLRSQTQKIKMRDVPRAQLFLERNSQLANHWLLSEVERRMRLEQRNEERETVREHPQMRLLGGGFAELFPRGPGHLRLPIKSGVKVPFLKMRRSLLLESAAAIRAGGKPSKATSEHREAKAAYLESIYKQSAPYALGHRNFTVEDYLKAKQEQESGNSETAKGGA